MRETRNNHEQEVRKNIEWRKVHRSTEVIAVGDLHGNWDAFVQAYTVSGIAKAGKSGNLEWTGGNKRVVFLGDILVDRYTDGLRILNALTKLQNQAATAGGKISILTGNHDTWFMAYLLEAGCEKRDIAGWMGVMRARPKQRKGLEELKKYNKSKNADILSEEARISIQEEVKKEGILPEQLSCYQLAEVHDDTLFLHCNPTEKIIEDLITRAHVESSLAKAVEKINTEFQQALKEMFQDNFADRTKWSALVNLYTNTDNRINTSDPQQKDALRKLGINAIIHGHSKPNPEIRYEPEGLLIVSADREYGKGTQEENGDDSLLVIRQNGDVCESYRGQVEEKGIIRGVEIGK